MKIYVSYVYDVLADAGYLLTDAIDTNDETYIAYKNDEIIGLSEFLRYALSQNWIDVSKLSLDSKIYQCRGHLSDTGGSDRHTPSRELCL